MKDDMTTVNTIESKINFLKHSEIAKIDIENASLSYLETFQDIIDSDNLGIDTKVDLIESTIHDLKRINGDSHQRIQNISQLYL